MDYGRPVVMPQVKDGGNPLHKPIMQKPIGAPFSASGGQKAPASRVTDQERAAVAQTRKSF